MTILDLVKSRHALAERFTEKFQDEVKQNLKDYKAEDSWLSSFADDNKLYTNVIKRYEIIIPMIFTNHEGMMASMFDRVPDVIVGQGGSDDEEKQVKVEAAYKYLKQKLDLESFMNTAAWWYILTGFVTAHVGYVKKTTEVPATDELGQPLMSQDGEQIMMTVYEEDDPEISVDDPMYTFFSPESKYSVRADQIPFYTRTKLMEVSDVLRTYDIQVEPDSTLRDYQDKKDSKSDVLEEDLKRSKIIMYYGNLKDEVADELEELGVAYDPDGWYYVVCTRSTLLYVERTPNDMRTCRTLKWYGIPTEFFGFGIAKLLRPFQKEKSLRRTQQSRYADVASYPKLVVPMETEIDEMAATDPRELPVLTYSGDKPEYMAPPDLSNVLILSEQKADQDAQQASGMLDISQGSQQSSTTDTATGQTIFADAAEKRVRFAKKKFMIFYKECVILLLKFAQLYWDEEKVVSITDDNGQEQEVTISPKDLSDVDFDKDITIDPDSITINKDVLRAQAIELYDRVKDDPLVDRREVFKDMMQLGFDKKNPDRYMRDMQVEPGTVLMNPQTGEQFTVDETGELVTYEAQQDMVQPEGGEVPMDQAGVMGAAQQL